MFGFYKNYGFIVLIISHYLERIIMQIFVTAFKNTISNMKSRFTSFFFYIICILTILSFSIPLDISGSDSEKLFSILVTCVLSIAAMSFFTEYLFVLNSLMKDTRFSKYSLLNIFVKQTTENYHICANLLTIVAIPSIIFIVIAIVTHIVLPIAITLGFMTLFILLSIS